MEICLPVLVAINFFAELTRRTHGTNGHLAFRKITLIPRKRERFAIHAWRTCLLPCVQ